jgi:hypothetical protein
MKARQRETQRPLDSVPRWAALCHPDPSHKRDRLLSEGA